jgi:hypothetical protein
MKSIGLLWSIIILLFSCEKKEEILLFTETDLKLEKTKDVEILYSDSSIVRIRIKAPALIFHLQASDPFQEFSEGIHIDFFNPQGKITSTLTADYAARYQSKKLTFLKKNVRWESINKEVMESPELTWNEETQNRLQYDRGSVQNIKGLPKFLKDDVPLFENIIQDLFPGVEKPNVENINLKNQMIESCKALNK